MRLRIRGNSLQFSGARLTKFAYNYCNFSNTTAKFVNNSCNGSTNTFGYDRQQRLQFLQYT